MKKLLSSLVFLSLVSSVTVVAQDNMGIGTAAPNPSAVLHLEASDKGLLIPRLTTAQRNAIASPATGLLVFDTNSNQFWYFDGTIWVQAIGPAGPAGTNGIDGVNGADGAVGPQGPIGLTGPAGANGIDGINGVDGAVGPQGPIGLTGPAGANGIDGINGVDGAVGPQGPIGLTGPAGANGLDGINGVDGAVGPQGPIGLTGPVGANGIDGVNGVDGAVGPQGPIGLTGPAGANGIDGINGVDGAVGPQGPIGLTGPAGANGIDGINGVDGAVGTQGPIGLTGPVGLTGATGATGPAGPTGLTGVTGSTGPAGPTGLTGATGATGATGPTWSISSLAFNSSGTISVATSQPATVTTVGSSWLVGGNALSAIGNFGTTTNNHIDLISNNIVRGRLSNLGEFFIGTTNTSLPGDLMNGVGNATFPWAVNGYSAFNGSGVYGSVTSGSTIYAGVQGEYYGTNTSGAGVRGIAGAGTNNGINGSNPAVTTGWAGLFQNDLGYTGFFGVASDQRIKTNIQTIASPLQLVKNMRGVTYEHRLDDARYSDLGLKSGLNYGFIAQEVEKVLPDLVREKNIPHMSGGIRDSKNQKEAELLKTVSYVEMIPILLEAIKEQQSIIEELKVRISKLEENK